MKRKLPCSFPAILLILITAQYEAGAQQRFDSLLTISANKYPEEKIYIHYDKSYYHPGETVWFKAYVTSKSNPSSISKTLYAELLDSNGIVLQRKIMPLLEATAASFFELDTLQHRKLFVRAYTPWMLNFDAAQLYVKPLTVFNPETPSSTEKNTAYSLTLFPEGGDLVEQLHCRVAFKANSKEGTPAVIDGTVVDDKNNTVATLKTMHDGMGIFSFMPQQDVTYYALWTDPGGLQHRQQLPSAKKEGVTLTVLPQQGALSYFLQRSNSAEVTGPYTVVAQMNQQTVYSAVLQMADKKLVEAAIPTDSATGGILVITVFNAAAIPVAERLAFVNNSDAYFNTSLQAADIKLAPHAKSVLKIEVPGNLLTNLSVAVTDAGLEAATDTKETIYSGLMLTSDLRGYVYNPGYYFSSNADSLKKHLDLVMLTNGWRRYRWEDMLASKWPALKNKTDDFLRLKGKITGLSHAELKGQSITAVLNAGKLDGSYLSIPVKEDGTLNISGLYFFDSLRMYYKFSDDEHSRLLSKAKLDFYNEFEMAPAYNMMAPQYFNNSSDIAVLQKSARQNTLYLTALNQQRVKTLKEVLVKTNTRQSSANTQYVASRFAGGPSVGYDPNPQVMVFNYVPTGTKSINGVSLTTEAMTPGANKIGAPVTFFLDNAMMPVSRTAAFSLPSTDYQNIKVMSPPVLMNVDQQPVPKGLNAVTINGYSEYREFYMPDYDKTVPDGGDYRNTLYWNPFVIMDSNNRTVTLPVFNSSNCKKMKVVIEGMNELGQLTREEKIFE